VVLGPGGERLLHALAGRHGADPFAGGHRKARRFKNWTVLLAIAAFSLSLLGTFLVRSGVLTSVHAFATDPRRGIFILRCWRGGRRLAVPVRLRAPKVGAGGAFGLVSRETMLLMNNVLLVVACGSVLLGTLYPLLIDALGLGKLSVGPPYFNAVFVPLMVPLLLLMAPVRWRTGSTPTSRRIAAPAAPSLALAVAAGPFPLLTGAWTPLVALGSPARRVDRRRGVCPDRGAPARAGRSPAAHLVGHAPRARSASPCSSSASPWSAAYQEEKDVRMEPDDTVQVGGYGFRFVGVRPGWGRTTAPWSERWNCPKTARC
jgi:cytochrome c-type biogenesis protein CcmF